MMVGPGKYRKRPVVVEAIQWNATNEVRDVVKEWALSAPNNVTEQGLLTWDLDDGLVIHTLEGSVKANVGDFIIRGVKGELYPCNHDIFAETYELAEEPIEDPNCSRDDRVVKLEEENNRITQELRSANYQLSRLNECRNNYREEIRSLIRQRDRWRRRAERARSNSLQQHSISEVDYSYTEKLRSALKYACGGFESLRLPIGACVLCNCSKDEPHTDDCPVAVAMRALSGN